MKHQACTLWSLDVCSFNWQREAVSTWLLRMLPGVRLGGRPNTPGPSNTIAPGTCPCLGASSRPPGRTIVYGMPERCKASSPRFFQNRTCRATNPSHHVLTKRHHHLKPLASGQNY